MKRCLNTFLVDELSAKEVCAGSELVALVVPENIGIDTDHLLMLNGTLGRTLRERFRNYTVRLYCGTAQLAEGRVADAAMHRRQIKVTYQINRVYRQKCF